MAYCINPKCNARHNPEPESQPSPDSSEATKAPKPDALNPHTQKYCRACGTPLLIQGRYRLSHPLRPLDEWSATEIFAVEDVKAVRADLVSAKLSDAKASKKDVPSPPLKVLKVLKQNRLLPLFEREARTLQQLHHPGLPRAEAGCFFAIPVKGLEEPLAALVMEKVEGETLEQWLIQHGRAKQKQAQDWLRQMVEILHQLHQQNLFHRDIKPSNVMRRADGQLVLIDFGTVKSVTPNYLAEVAGDGEVTSFVSPGYTPLEQINGKAVPQSDFYAWGRSLVHLVTGKSPLDFPEDPQTGKLLWREAAPHISENLALLIDRLIAPFPGQRPPNTEAILQHLEQGLGPIPRARLRLQVVGLVLLNLLLLFTHGFVFGQWSAAWRDYADHPSSAAASKANESPADGAPDVPADR